MAALKESSVAVFQGADESFLRFADRLSASVKKQVGDPEAKKLLLKLLVRSNCNANCRRIIEALPGDPSVPHMAEACAKVGTSGHKMAALATAAQPDVATAVQPVWALLQGGQQQQGNAQASKNRERRYSRSQLPWFCVAGVEGQTILQIVCKATVHANGQALLGSGNGKRSATERRAQTQASLRALVPMEVCLTGLQPAPTVQRVLMSAQQQQLS